MKYSKSWTEVLQEVKSKSQKEDASNDKSDDGEGLDKVDPKAVKKKFKDRKDKDIDNDGDTDSTDKYLHKRRKAISKAVSADEQVGVRKVDFVDGVTPELEEAKGEFEVKYASSKKGPIKVSTFNTLEDAKKFLAQVKKEGMNGIISKGGKPVKEDHHEKDANGEPIPHDDEEGLQEHCGECGAMDHVDEKMDGRKKFSGKQAKKDNEDRRAAQRKKLGILGPNEEVDEGAYLKTSGYELYHKDFSSAMQHSYDIARKRGFTVDPEEIDNKVATGPRKPSKGKTNRYILGTDKKQNLHVQVTNLDNKRFELNMYMEETEKENMDIEETIKQVVEGSYKKKKMEDASNDKSDDGEGMDKVDPKAVKKKFKDRKDKDLDNDGDTDSTDKYLHKRRKAISKAVDKEEQKEAYQEAEISKKTNDDTTAIGFASKGVKKKAKEPQEETLLDKVKGMMKEKKYKK